MFVRPFRLVIYRFMIHFRFTFTTDGYLNESQMTKDTLIVNRTTFTQKCQRVRKPSSMCTDFFLWYAEEAQSHRSDGPTNLNRCNVIECVKGPRKIEMCMCGIEMPFGQRRRRRLPDIPEVIVNAVLWAPFSFRTRIREHKHCNVCV